MTMADERRELEVILSAWVWLATGHSLLYFLGDHSVFGCSLVFFGSFGCRRGLFKGL